MTQTYDVIIIGAGPAGLSTALHLAKIDPQLAARTLVLEKALHPRPKLCAGGLTVDAEVILDALGLDVNEVPQTRADSVLMQFAGRGLELHPPKGPALRIVRRDEFDHWLAEKAREQGIEIREDTRVTNILPEGNMVRVETDSGEFQARMVVGADGSNGVVRNCILPKDPLRTARLLEVLSPPATNSKHMANSAYFDFFCVPNGIAGYSWDFPTQLKGVPMRCWGIFDNNLLADSRRAALRSQLDEEMQRHGAYLADSQLKGHPIRWFSPFAQFSVPCVLLAGDAAGSDPLLGEGISLALGYGRLAAQSIQMAINKNDLSFKDYRMRILCSPLGQSLTLRFVFTHILFTFRWHWFQRLVWHFLHPLVKIAGWVLLLNWAKRMR